MKETYTHEEVRLLLKEQAKIVRHAAYDKINDLFVNDPLSHLIKDGRDGIAREMMNLRHDWVIDVRFEASKERE